MSQLHRVGRASTALTLLALGLVSLVLAAVEACTSALHLSNLVAAAVPGPACAALLLGLMMRPHTSCASRQVRLRRRCLNDILS